MNEMNERLSDSLHSFRYREIYDILLKRKQDNQRVCNILKCVSRNCFNAHSCNKKQCIISFSFACRMISYFTSLSHVSTFHCSPNNVPAMGGGGLVKLGKFRHRVRGALSNPDVKDF